MRHSIYLVAGSLAVGIFATLATGTAIAGEKCKCRFNGVYIDEGKTACLKTPDGFSLARCEKVLNNTSWKQLDQPCPIANLQQDISPSNKQTPFPSKQVAYLIPKI